MTGLKLNGDQVMSKRARITLDAGVDPETDAEQVEYETEADPFPETDLDSETDSPLADDTPPGIILPGGIALNTGTLVKTAFAGLAVVALVLLWKNRRP